MGQRSRQVAEQRQQAQQPQLRILEQRVYPTFGVGVEDAGGGARTLHFFLPDGKQLSFPFSPETAKETGGKMIAPSVQAATMAEMPSENGGS